MGITWQETYNEMGTNLASKLKWDENLLGHTLPVSRNEIVRQGLTWSVSCIEILTYLANDLYEMVRLGHTLPVSCNEIRQGLTWPVSCNEMIR